MIVAVDSTGCRPCAIVGLSFYNPSYPLSLLHGVKLPRVRYRLSNATNDTELTDKFQYQIIKSKDATGTSLSESVRSERKLLDRLLDRKVGKPHCFRNVGRRSLQDADIDLLVVDGKHNRTGRRWARSLGNSRLIVGSNPTHPIISFLRVLSSARQNTRSKRREAVGSNPTGSIAGIDYPACAERWYRIYPPLETPTPTPISPLIITSNVTLHHNR